MICSEQARGSDTLQWQLLGLPSQPSVQQTNHDFKMKKIIAKMRRVDKERDSPHPSVTTSRSLPSRQSTNSLLVEPPAPATVLTRSPSHNAVSGLDRTTMHNDGFQEASQPESTQTGQDSATIRIKETNAPENLWNLAYEELRAADSTSRLTETYERILTSIYQNETGTHFCFLGLWKKRSISGRKILTTA